MQQATVTIEYQSPTAAPQSPTSPRPTLSKWLLNDAGTRWKTTKFRMIGKHGIVRSQT